jgi:hypothetical protein
MNAGQLLIYFNRSLASIVFQEITLKEEFELSFSCDHSVAASATDERHNAG